MVALGLACAFAAEWVRSLSVYDQIAIPCEQRRSLTFVNSSLGLIHCSDFIMREERSHFLKNSRIGVSSNKASVHPVDREHRFEVRNWRFRLLGFRVGEFENSEYGFSQTYVSVPYWSIVIPLTLLSAYLLISKLRQKPTPPVNHV